MTGPASPRCSVARRLIPRVCSLLPSATEIVGAHRLARRPVGRVRLPRRSRPGLPVLPPRASTRRPCRAATSTRSRRRPLGCALYAVDEELIRELRPDVVITHTCAMSVPSRATTSAGSDASTLRRSRSTCGTGCDVEGQLSSSSSGSTRPMPPEPSSTGCGGLSPRRPRPSQAALPCRCSWRSGSTHRSLRGTGCPRWWHSPERPSTSRPPASATISGTQWPARTAGRATPRRTPARAARPATASAAAAIVPPHPVDDARGGSDAAEPLSELDHGRLDVGDRARVERDHLGVEASDPADVVARDGADVAQVLRDHDVGRELADQLLVDRVERPAREDGVADGRVDVAARQHRRVDARGGDDRQVRHIGAGSRTRPSARRASRPGRGRRRSRWRWGGASRRAGSGAQR